MKIDQTFLWTDSTIVLHWIHTSPHQLKTFVANRVSEIQSKSNVDDWRHVRTHDNPADIASRGQTPEEFLQPSNWQQGPPWLCQGEEAWPSSTIPQLGELPEQRRATCLIATKPVDFAILTLYSSISKLQRVIAYCMRFGTKSKGKGALTVLELRTALHIILKMTQRSVFAEEIDSLNGGRSLQRKNKLTRLNPFIDEDGILRVGGRLQHSMLPFSARHPVILPKNHHVTALIILNEHRLHFHTGTQATLYAVRRCYWPLDGRSQVWKTIKPCLICNRAKPPSTNYVMGNLPKHRVTEARPFAHVGVDYCGPFLLKEKKYRNRNRIKAY
ncbi:MAG: hypothetical protein MN733_08220, partial [Nitrososphaera sp.]|nr:hypothetical protein [Nitrososphaera sp.]